MPDSDLLAQVRNVVERAWNEGCPVAGSTQEQWEETAQVAVRRWQSRHRRGVRGDHQSWKRDLANGLIAAFEREPRLVGRLKTDYLYLAERMLEVLAA